MKHARNSRRRARRPADARFELRHPNATGVYLAGTFNDWRPEATPMVPVGDGRWIVELPLGPGSHEYRFVVDGEWVDDPSAPETVPNAFGGRNAVRRIDDGSSWQPEPQR